MCKTQHERKPEHTSDRPDDNSASSSHEASVKESIDKARTKARGGWRVLKAVVRPLLPKKWTGRNIAIAVVVVIAALFLLNLALSAIMGVFRYVIVFALVAAGIYLLLTPRT